MAIKKHKIIVILDWASLNKDVQDKAYRMARLAKLGVADQVAADRFESEISLGDEDMSLLKRAMAQGLAEVVTMCGEYVWNTSHMSDNYIVKDKNVTLTLMMPVNFNLAGCESLGQMIHAYIVAKAMTEWYRYTVPARVEEQMVLSENARREIQKILGARVRMLTNVKVVEIIVGNDGKPTVTMLYATSNDYYTEIPGTGNAENVAVKTTNERSITIKADDEHIKYGYVALPLGYTPLIAGTKVTRQIGKVVYNDMVYVWWVSDIQYSSDFVITY